MSGGQQQRLCIARALATDPDVILMDEPCSALDPISTARIEDLLHRAAQNYAIVIVTHNMQQAARVSDRTAFFTVELDEGERHRTGRIVEFDATEKIFQNPATRAPRPTSQERSGDWMSATTLERPKRHVGCAAVGDYDVVVEPLRIRRDLRCVCIDDHEIPLTPRELQILLLLAAEVGHVVTKDRLLAEMGALPTPGFQDRRVDVHVSHLRAKLTAAAPDWAFIHTHQSVGYRLHPSSSATGA